MPFADIPDESHITRNRNIRFQTTERNLLMLCIKNGISYKSPDLHETGQQTRNRRKRLHSELQLRKTCCANGLTYVPPATNETPTTLNERRRKLRIVETPDPQAQVRRRQKAQMRQENETPDERRKRIEAISQRARERRDNDETPDERRRRIEAISRRARERRDNDETPDERGRRLEAMSQRARVRRDNDGTPDERRRRLEAMSQRARERRDNERRERRERQDNGNGLNQHGVPVIEVEIDGPMRKAQKHICRTLVKGTKDSHQALVCVICDELIIGTEEICSVDKTRILKHKQRLSVESYNEFFGGSLDPVVVKQYEVSDLPGLLLSPRSPRDGDKFVACKQCKAGMRDQNINNEHPPKKSIGNGFATGYIPLRSIIQQMNGPWPDGTDIELEERFLTPVLCAAIAPVRPYAHIFSYTGGRHASIRGNYQFFEADHSKLAEKLGELDQHGHTSNVYVVLAGSMTPAQKTIIRKKRELNKSFYIELLKWFTIHHPGFCGVTVRCPPINLVEDPDSIHNTDTEGNVEVEKVVEDGGVFFTSGDDPQKGTSVYKTTRALALALLENRAAPTLVIQGGRYSTHAEIAHLENVCPIQFPFGSGGPTLRRRVPISDEEVLRHYLRLSLPQFMRSEFVLLANHMLNRILSYKSAIVKCRPIVNNGGTSFGDTIATMTIEDIKEAVNEEAEKDRLRNAQCQIGGNVNSGMAQSYTTAQKFLKAVRTSCRSMGHTKEAAEYARRKCFALQDFFGMHSLFFTITPDDECSFRVMLYANAGNIVSSAQRTRQRGCFLFHVILAVPDKRNSLNQRFLVFSLLVTCFQSATFVHLMGISFLICNSGKNIAQSIPGTVLLIIRVPCKLYCIVFLGGTQKRKREQRASSVS